MNAAIRVEALKLARSPVGLITTLAMVLGIFALLGGITAGVAGGNRELIAQAGPAAALDWNGLLAGAVQVTAVAGVLGFGVVLAWMFGREFTDGTITGLFALPVSRSRIAFAKLTVYVSWAAAVSIALVCGVLSVGLLAGYGPPSSGAWGAFVRLWVLAIFSAGIAIPIAWIATVTRSLLAAVGSTIGLVVAAQVGALAGAGGWMPLAAPALWAMSNGADVTLLQLGITAIVALAFTALTCVAWSRLQLDR